MRVALTGGASGIGAALAAKLKQQGHHVTAFDLHEPSVQVDHWIRTDLSEAASIAAAVASVEGPFDALVNNAGIPPRAGMEALVLRINFFGLKTFLDAMLDKLSAGAAIVNTASRAGAQWRENLAEVKALLALDEADLPGFLRERAIDGTRAYNLSKEAVIVLTMARAEEMQRRGLRMNSVSPAAVSTGIFEDFAAAFGEKMARNLARTGRPGTADEVADVIAFLVSPQSGWIRGQDIVIDGGMSAMQACEALDI